MKKYTYHTTAGVKYAFPSCKTFVFSRCNFDVSFRFISMWNKVDKEIDAFHEAFSITASNYFLQIEVISSADQEITAILIDDERIEYQPIMGSIEIANTPLPITVENLAPLDITGSITNTVDTLISNSGISINQTVPVLQPAGQVLHVNTAADLDHHPTEYTNYSVEHFFSYYHTPSAHATQIHCCSPNTIAGTSEPGKYQYLTELKIIPNIDCNFLIYLFGYNGSIAHGYDVSIFEKFYKNIVWYNNETSYQRLLTKTVLLSDFSGTDILYEKINLQAGKQTIIKFEIPIKLDCRSSWGTVPYGYCTLCTDIPCEYEIFLKTKYYRSAYLIPKTFV